VKNARLNLILCHCLTFSASFQQRFLLTKNVTVFKRNAFLLLNKTFITATPWSNQGTGWMRGKQLNDIKHHQDTQLQQQQQQQLALRTDRQPDRRTDGQTKAHHEVFRAYPTYQCNTGA